MFVGYALCGSHVVFPFSHSLEKECGMLLVAAIGDLCVTDGGVRAAGASVVGGDELASLRWRGNAVGNGRSAVGEMCFAVLLVVRDLGPPIFFFFVPLSRLG